MNAKMAILLMEMDEVAHVSLRNDMLVKEAILQQLIAVACPILLLL